MTSKTVWTMNGKPLPDADTEKIKSVQQLLWDMSFVYRKDDIGKTIRAAIEILDGATALLEKE